MLWYSTSTPHDLIYHDPPHLELLIYEIGVLFEIFFEEIQVFNEETQILWKDRKNKRIEI
jgi:hypothetical protein